MLLVLLMCGLSQAFVFQHQQSAVTTLAANSKKTFVRIAAELSDHDGVGGISSDSLDELPTSNLDQLGKVVMSAVAVWGTTAQVVLADSPDWGLFEGRTGSLLHPITMGSMFLYSLYTAFLGFQWRRQRTLGDEISALKKSMPSLDGAESVSAALTKAKESNDLYKINSLTAALEIESQVNTLIAERKSLAEAGPRDKHFQQGAFLAFIGTVFAIEGPLNTYARAGKLFPGPHLYAGAGLVCLWALAAACVPAMQKGSDLARSVHIGANAAGIAMFAWQVSSGLPILFKVIELTKWP